MGRQLASLEDVIEHCYDGGIWSPHLDEEITPLRLSDAEKRDLIAFLRSLTGTNREADRGGQRSGLGRAGTLYGAEMRPSPPGTGSRWTCRTCAGRGFSSSASGVEPPFAVPVLYLYHGFLAFLEDSELCVLCKLLSLLGLIWFDFRSYARTPGSSPRQSRPCSGTTRTANRKSRSSTSHGVAAVTPRMRVRISSWPARLMGQFVGASRLRRMPLTGYLATRRGPPRRLFPAAPPPCPNRAGAPTGCCVPAHSRQRTPRDGRPVKSPVGANRLAAPAVRAQRSAPAVAESGVSRSARRAAHHPDTAVHQA